MLVEDVLRNELRVRWRRQQIRDKSTRFLEKGRLYVTLLVYPDGQVQEVDGSGLEVEWLVLHNLKLDCVVEGIEVVDELSQFLFSMLPKEEDVVNETLEKG